MLTAWFVRWVKKIGLIRTSISKTAHLVVLFLVTLFVSLVGLVSYLFGPRLESLFKVRVVSIHEALLRVLLRQRHWMYDQSSLVAQLYFGVVRALSVRRPSTLEFRNVLPRLPVPSLTDSCASFLDSVRHQLCYKDYADAQQAVREFLRHGGVGQMLQSHLKRRALIEDNWASGLWQRYHYMRDRQPLPILSNWYGNDCPNPPTTWNVKRAANWIVAGLKFKLLLDRGAITPIRLFDAVPIDMSNYRYIFGSSRIPGLEEDHLYHVNGSRHIAVVYRRQWFHVEVIDEHGEPYNLREIVSQIQLVLQEGDLLSDKQAFAPLGVLTTLPRSDWARARDYLCALSQVNQQSLESIESSLFVVCMESHSVNDLTEQARTMFHGDGRNRWFDKSFQLITTANSVTSVNGEHSCCDAPVIAYLGEFALVHEQRTTDAELNQPRKSGLPRHKPLRLNWVLDAAIERTIHTAEQRIDAAIADVDLVVLRFNYFGKGFIKESQFSPDAFIQIALQLAYYRLHGSNPHTYETAQTRMFLCGRTETVRSCCADTCAVTRALDDPRVDVRTKYDLMVSAIRNHALAVKRAMTGKGCDRHLWALKILSESLCQHTPRLFNTVAFNLPWKLSTSQNAVRMGSGGGFGPTCADGYGIAYLPHEQEIFFHITSFFSSCQTSSAQLSDAIQKALCDMQGICFGLQPSQQSSPEIGTPVPFTCTHPHPPAPTFPDVHEQIRGTYFEK